MLKARVMPCLLLAGGSLVKTVRFNKQVYIGDPINAVRIYNDMEVDELIFLDITATATKSEPQYKLIESLAGECFMPLTYGGGVRTIEQMRRLFSIGVEKIAINTAIHEVPSLIEEAACLFGNQAIIASIDSKRNIWGKNEVVIRNGHKHTGIKPEKLAIEVAKRGAGELLITSVDRDGTWKGYDVELVRSVADVVNIPVIAAGGAGSLEDIRKVIVEGHASAAAIGSMAVFQGEGLGVLIKFPLRKDILRVLSE